MEVDLATATTLSVSYGTRRTKSKGPYTYFLSLDPVSGDAVAVNGFSGFRADTDAADATLRSQFSTGPISHRLAVSGSMSREKDRFPPFSETDPYSTNIFNYVRGPVAAVGSNGPVASIAKTTSYGIADTIGLFDDRLLITGGVRRITIQSDGDANGDGKLETLYKQSATTPAAGVVFKVTGNLSLYGNYIEGLEPGQTAPLNTGNPQDFVSNPGEIFGPTPARQAELGAKLDMGKVGITAAIFRIRRPSFEIDAVTRRFGPIGQQTNKGIELNIFGEPLPRLRLLAGYAYIDAVLSKTIDAAIEGNTAGGVPKHTATLSAEWDTPFVDGLTLVARSRVQSSQFSDSSNAFKASGHGTLGLGANYRLPTDRPVILRAFVDNVTNEHFFVSFARGRSASEDPRTFRLSIDVDF